MLFRRLKIFVVPYLLLGPLIQTGCTQDSAWQYTLEKVRSDFPDVIQLSTDSLAVLIDANTDLVLLDTREFEEYEVSHIANAIHIDPDQPDFGVLADVDLGAQMVAYCSVGYRSSAIVTKLNEMGYTNVSNLEGSIFKWANEGRPVVRDSVGVRHVHQFDKFWGRLLNEDLRATL